MTGRPPRKRRPPKQTCPVCGKRFHGWVAGAPCPACKREAYAGHEPGWVPPAQHAAGNRAQPGRQTAPNGETTVASASPPGDALSAAPPTPVSSVQLTFGGMPPRRLTGKRAAQRDPDQLDLLTDAGGYGPVDGGVGDGLSWHDWFVSLSTAGGQAK